MSSAESTPTLRREQQLMWVEVEDQGSLLASRSSGGDGYATNHRRHREQMRLPHHYHSFVDPHNVSSLESARKPSKEQPSLLFLDR